MAGILKVDRIQEANSGQGVELSHKLVDTSGNTIISENNGVATFGTSVAPSTNYTFRNKIINGNFDIWQRGTSQTSNGYGSADRWRSFASGSTLTASQQSFTLGQTDVPGNPKYYFRYAVSSVSGSGNSGRLMQRIEDVSSLAGQTVTLSFWAKADSNKNIATEFTRNFGTGGSPSTTEEEIHVTTYNLTTSWQKFTATVSIPSISGKTIGSDGNDYFQLLFWFDAGSNFNSRTNSLGQQSGTFDIAQVQLEESTVPTPFEHRHIGMELSLCQRYFQNFRGDAGMSYNRIFLHKNAYYESEAFIFPVEMRDAPAMSHQGIFVRELNASSTTSATESFTADRKGFHATSNVTNNSNFYTFVCTNVKADAEL
jgi:hypothetical protein